MSHNQFLKDVTALDFSKKLALTVALALVFRNRLSANSD
jgi:hypothetical protein